MRKVTRIGKKSSRKIRVVSQEEYEGMEASSRMDLIEALIPLGLKAVEEELQREVQMLAGVRYSRGPMVRYGTNAGSVVLGGQRVAIDVPRIRSAEREIPLQSYRQLHRGRSIEDAVLVHPAPPAIAGMMEISSFEATGVACPRSVRISVLLTKMLMYARTCPAGSRICSLRPG